MLKGQRSPLKGRKWTKEQKAKYQATRAANKAARQATPEGINDARTYLRHALVDINERIRSGQLKKRDRAHLLMELALDVLGG